MISENTKKQYLRAGKILMPLKGKIPLVEGWRDARFTDEEILDYKGNLGWNIGPDDLIIDVDPRNGGVESWEKFKKLLNLKLQFTLKTPRGGHHIYLKIPEKFKNYDFKKTLSDYPGIDFLTEGSYCLIRECKTEHGIYEWVDDLFGEFVEEILPSQVANFIGKERTKSDLGDFEGLIGGESSSWSKEKVVSMLERLDPSMQNNNWVKVGMALHDWDPIEGFELWEEWSKDGDNYEEGETEKRWRSFDIGGGVTLGTISYMVKEVNFDENLERVQTFLDRIKLADEKTLEFEIFRDLKKSNFGKIHIEKIAKGVQDRYKELSSVKIPIGNIRQLITGSEIVSGQFLEDGETPAWCKDWVYVNSHTSFVNLEQLKIHKTESFNIINGKYVPESPGGTKNSASKYISDKGFIETVDVMSYLPSIKDKLCEIDGYKILNSFNPKTIPTEASEYTEQGLKAIELVKKHIKFICTTEENSQIFTEWLAHNIQFPGKQILWSPVIQSIQGVGKSFFGELMRICLGDRNVGTISPSQVISDYNGWATNVIVNVLEELRVKGHNRYDAVNSLKPLITDRMIQINDKHTKQFMTYNTTNYICFTNYKDAIPLDGDDRRWWVIFVPIDSLEEMEKYVGEPAIVYFPGLFSSMREYGHEIRKWFLEFKISEKFLKTKQAPMTHHKMSMIATEEAGFEAFLEIKDLLLKGGKFFNSEVISSNDLFEALMFENSELEIKRSQRGHILKKLGFSALPHPIFIGGKTRRVWTKKNLTNEEIRKSLESEEL